MGLARHRTYEELLHMASQKKAGIDRLDEVSNVRKIGKRETSLRNDTGLHRTRVVEQSKRVQEIYEIGPRNVGTCDASRAFLSRPKYDPNRFSSNPNSNASIEEELDRLNNIGVLAANANTEDVYSTVEEDYSSNKGADNESDDESILFDSDGKQNSEWSQGKLTNFVNHNVN